MISLLQDIADIAAGHPFRKKIEPSVDGVLAIQMKDINAGLVQWNSVVRTDIGSKKTDFLQNGDILCAGKARNNYFILLNGMSEGTICSPHFFRLRIKDERLVLPPYLNWLLNSNKVQSRLQAEQMGTTTVSIRKDTLQELKIPLPPLEEQRKLVRLIEAVNAHTQRQLQLVDNNDQLMNGIAQHLFSQYGALAR